MTPLLPLPRGALALRARRVSWALTLLAAAAACDGYGDLPIPQREDAALQVEASSLRPGSVGIVQALVPLPADATGPLVVVAGPVTGGDGAAQGAAVQGWAWGPCPGLGGVEAPPGPHEVRLCLAVWTPAAAPLELACVVEARGAARRFTARGEVAW